MHTTTTGRTNKNVRQTARQPNVDVRIDPHRLEVYACGINAMVYGLETAVSHPGVSTNHIHCEGYG